MHTDALSLLITDGAMNPSAWLQARVAEHNRLSWYIRDTSSRERRGQEMLKFFPQASLFKQVQSEYH